MVKRIAAFAAAGIGAVLLVALLFSLSADSYSDGPPMMLLVAGGGQYEAGIGSFCGTTGPTWFGSAVRCVDRTLEGSLPDGTVAISQGSRFEVRMVDYQHPELLGITLRDAGLNVTGLELTRLSGAEFAADVPKGDYVLNIFAKWDNAGMGDASYFYRISVV